MNKSHSRANVLIIVIVSIFMGSPSVLAQAMDSANPMIVDVRVYYIHDGYRREFEALFAETVPYQEQHGIRVLGQFVSLKNIIQSVRNEDDDNYFIWIRAFPNMEARKRRTEKFFAGDD